MSNGHGNCIYAVCCPPGSETQIDALAGQMYAALPNLSPSNLREVASWVIKTYDLAPAGSLQVLKDVIRDYAREGYTRGPLSDLEKRTLPEKA